MLKSLAERTDRLYFSPVDQTRNALRQVYDDARDDLELDFGSRVISVLERVISAEADVSGIKRQSRAENALKSLRDYELGRRLREFAAEEGISFFIVADDLDKHWRSNTKESIDLLIGLIAEVSRMQRYFGQYLKVVLFLREDIYDVLTQYDEDLPKRDILRMEWTTANLKHLVAERLAIQADQPNDSDEETWVAIFPEPVKNMPAVDYILSRSLPRPRDVINLCQRAIDQAQRNGHSYVTSEDVLDGESSFSEALFYAVASEFKGLYPHLDHVLIEFGSIAEKTAWSEFQYITNSAIESRKEILASWVGIDSATPLALAEVLFRIGLIGLSREWTSTVQFSNGRSFSDTWGLVSPTPIVHIHPAFMQFLDISETVLSAPRVPARRQRGVSPLQMSFDDKTE